MTSLRLTNIVIAQQTAHTQIIGWRLLGIPSESIGATVRIYRSTVDHDGFVLVAAVPADTGYYLDTAVNTSDRWIVQYYRLEVVDNSGDAFTHGPVRINYEIDAVSMALLKATNTAVKLGGDPILVYQRKSDPSPRCSVCWDSVLRKTTDSRCLSCFNTGYAGGYFNPILTLSVVAPVTKANAPSDTNRQSATTIGLLSNYPILRPKDLICALETGKRYRVVSIQPTEKGRMLVNQNAVLEELNPEDIEHNIPIIDLSTLAPLLVRPTVARRLITYQAADNVIKSVRI